MNVITVKMWKDINTFDPMENGVFNVDGTVERVAMVTGKTVAEVEEMPMNELLPTFLECVKTVNREVFAKLDVMPKNGSGAE